VKVKEHWFRSKTCKQRACGWMLTENCSLGVPFTGSGGARCNCQRDRHHQRFRGCQSARRSGGVRYSTGCVRVVGSHLGCVCALRNSAELCPSQQCRSVPFATVPKCALRNSAEVCPSQQCRSVVLRVLTNTCGATTRCCFCCLSTVCLVAQTLTPLLRFFISCCISRPPAAACRVAPQAQRRITRRYRCLMTSTTSQPPSTVFSSSVTRERPGSTPRWATSLLFCWCLCGLHGHVTISVYSASRSLVSALVPHDCPAATTTNHYHHHHHHRTTLIPTAHCPPLQFDHHH
jgi:hypothetical protein